MPSFDPCAADLARAFVAAFAACDMDAMAALLADRLESHITNEAGGTDTVTGRDAFMARITAMNLAAVAPTITLTQITNAAPDTVLAMVEVEAKHGGRTLHNFAALLLTVEAGRITTFRMVEAKPSESAAFWSAAGH